MKRARYACGLCAVVLMTALPPTQVQSAAARQLPASQAQMQLSFAPLVKKVMPTVVNVYAARQVRVRTPFSGDPFFEQFFGRSFRDQSRIQSSLGSGVLVDAAGLIVTNYHVIRDADDIKVALSDGREFASTVILKDEATDIAVLRLKARGESFPVMTLADSDRVEVGDLVLAIGNPFGVGQTVTSGIVSAQARTRVGISDFDFFIQTDAAINPGNSGGALINMKGELIGVNSAIYSRTGGSIGIGFAIPSNLVRSVVEAVKHGKTTLEQPYLGATFQPMSADIAASLGMQKAYGALITDIVKNSPADKAGLKVGDVIVKAHGSVIENTAAFGYRLMTTGVGKPLKLGVLRNGNQFDTTVTLQLPPSDLSDAAERIDISSPLAGVEVMNLTPLNVRRFHQLPGSRGVVISNIDERSNAAMMFAKGDIIRAVNGQPVHTVKDLKKVLAARAPSVWQFQYERDGLLIRQFIR